MGWTVTIYSFTDAIEGRLGRPATLIFSTCVIQLYLLFILLLLGLLHSENGCTTIVLNISNHSPVETA
jgi:hypothetical protein